MISEASRRDLELPSLLAVVAELASTDIGRARIRELRPLPTRRALDSVRESYAEVRGLLDERPLIPFQEDPLEPVLRALATGRSLLGGMELVHLRCLLEVVGDLRRRVEEAEPSCARLAERLGIVPELDTLRHRIAKALDQRGAVRDDASPRLVALRRSIRSERDGLHQKLARLTQTHREILSEETVAHRDGRLMVLLKAGSRGREPGLVHGRSGSGQSFYFEPLDTVEANNSLQQALADAEQERARIVRELIEMARSHLPAIESAAELVSEIDFLQAASRFADRSLGRQIELGSGSLVHLKAARHPLLDPALSDLRQAALGHPGHQGDLVPLDLELEEPQRALVITGPNAGGKTVVLKTLGLLAVAAHCGLPVPVDEGSRLPLLARVVAAIGDEQDLLEDRSTFSGRLLRLKEAWQESGERTLVLLDELGSGTDPEEGAALAVATLEGLLDRHCLIVVTTHLTRVAAAALELERAGCAAMDFDPRSSAPTYLLERGAPGGSEALSLARRLGLPEPLVVAAEARLSPEHRDFRRLLAETEALRLDLGDQKSRLASERRALESARLDTESKASELERERELVGRRMRSELDAFRIQVTKRLAVQEESLLEQLREGRKQPVQRAVRELFEEAPVPELAKRVERPPEVGHSVRHKGLGWRGRLASVRRGRAQVEVKGKRLSCPLEELAADEASAPSESKPRARSEETLFQDSARPELHLIGLRVESALESLDRYLDRALLESYDEVRVVHGHGTGRLRKAVRAHLRNHPAAVSTRPGGQGEGGEGVTMVRLSPS